MPRAGGGVGPGEGGRAWAAGVTGPLCRGAGGGGVLQHRPAHPHHQGPHGGEGLYRDPGWNRAAWRRAGGGRSRVHPGEAAQAGRGTDTAQAGVPSLPCLAAFSVWPQASHIPLWTLISSCGVECRALSPQVEGAWCGGLGPAGPGRSAGSHLGQAVLCGHSPGHWGWRS